MDSFDSASHSAWRIPSMNTGSLNSKEILFVPIARTYIQLIESTLKYRKWGRTTIVAADSPSFNESTRGQKRAKCACCTSTIRSFSWIKHEHFNIYLMSQKYVKKNLHMANEWKQEKWVFSLRMENRRERHMILPYMTDPETIQDSLILFCIPAISALIYMLRPLRRKRWVNSNDCWIMR